MKKLLTVGFFALLLGTGILSMGLCAALGVEEENVENRTLAPAPVFSLENFENLPAQTESWLNDHAPFRSRWLDLYAALNLTLFQSVDNPEVIVGKEDFLFYGDKGTLEELTGIRVFPEEEMETLLEELLLVRETYVDRPEDFVFFVAPDKEKVYEEYLPDAYGNRTGTSRARELVRYIREHSDIQVVYPLEELQSLDQNPWPMYFQTDTHWNRLGSFAASQELLEALGCETASLSELTVTENGNRAGDLARLAHYPESKVDDMDFLYSGYYENTNPVTIEDDLNGNGIKETVNPSAPDKRRLILLQDSFGDVMHQTLCRYFSSVTSVNWERLSAAPKDRLFGDLFVYEVVEREIPRIPGDLAELLDF